MANIPLGGDGKKAILAIMVGDRLVIEDKGEMTSFIVEDITGNDSDATITLTDENQATITRTIEYVRVD